MSVQEPRLAWTLLLRPRGGSLAAAPTWPSLVLDRFGEVPLGPLPSVQQVLEGPLPIQVLSRCSGEQERWVLSGLGRSLGITVVVAHDVLLERFVPVEELRRRAILAFVGSETDDDDELDVRLRQLVEGEGSWEFLGLIEVVASLGEGAPPARDRRRRPRSRCRSMATDSPRCLAGGAERVRPPGGTEATSVTSMKP